MTKEQAVHLSERIAGQFQMLRQFLNDEAKRAYYDAFKPYDSETVKALISEVLEQDDQPPTAGWFARKLKSMTSQPAAPLSHEDVPRVSPAGARRLFREGYQKGWERDHPDGIFERDCADVIAQWRRIDRHGASDGQPVMVSEIVGTLRGSR